MSHPIEELLSRREFTAVGLMSGTSMDGVDAALVGLGGEPDAPLVLLRGFVTAPYPDDLRDTLEEMSTGASLTASEVATAATGVAVSFAGAFFEACREAGVASEKVDFIGSHGQTVAHVPPSPRTTIAGTLQLGAPGAIAALTGVTTVGDFRVGDLALGGQGAPLAPVADWLLRRSDEKGRVILNIGGIANVTFLPRGCARQDVVAFDTGPGNMVVDALHRALYGGREGFDRGGAHALQGRVNTDVLAAMRNHPYFALAPPKSAGHAEFGPQFAWQMQKIAEAHGLDREDSMATAAALTAETIADALETHVMPRGPVDEIFVTGGGVHNQAVMKRLRERLATEVDPIDALGIPADAKEAVDFALLAREALFGRTNVMPGVTGAARALVLGSIAMGGHA